MATIYFFFSDKIIRKIERELLGFVTVENFEIIETNNLKKGDKVYIFSQEAEILEVVK